MKPPYLPMEALSVDEVPEGENWQYEPKWDGFRCVIFKDEEEVYLQSKAGQPLARYFPEVVENVRRLNTPRCILDSELVVAEGESLSFDNLLMRIHPAESRINKLAEQTPATLIVFDLLMDATGEVVVEKPLSERRKLLEGFAKDYFPKDQTIRLSPATRDLSEAKRWLEKSGSSLDGIIAKKLDIEYRSGDRTGMEKYKPITTVDCVVGGFRYGTKGKLVGSMLLGLYDEAGILHHVGFTSGIKAAERGEVTAKLENLKGGTGFTGKAPGGPSRGSTERSSAWEALDPSLVVEVSFDHFTGGRFRHGTKFLRWRPDKDPKQCIMDQVASKGKGSLRLLNKSTQR